MGSLNKEKDQAKLSFNSISEELKSSNLNLDKAQERIRVLETSLSETEDKLLKNGIDASQIQKLTKEIGKHLF